jgi:stage II sporulation protein AA (anti-sigma F factor antagonist)
MQLTLSKSDNDVACVQCEGSISQDGFKPGMDPIEELLGADCYKRIVLMNLDRTHYIDSSGVGWLMGRNKQFRQSGGRLIIHSVPPIVSQVLQLLRMGMVLELAPDEATALTRVTGGKK